MQTRRRNAWRDKSGRILCGVTTRGAGHKTFPRLFFDASPHGIPGQSIEASPSTRIFPSIRDPPIRYRSLAVSEHPLHSSSSSSSSARNRRQRTLRGDKRLRSGVDPRIHLRFFHRPPRYLPFFTTAPFPSLDPFERRVTPGNFISYRPATRFPDFN